MNLFIFFDDLLLLDSFFETTQTLFWTAFGEVDLKNFSLTHVREPTKFWGMLMYGSFCVISIVVLLNLLIAMMDHSYNQIFVSSLACWFFFWAKYYFCKTFILFVFFEIIQTEFLKCQSQTFNSFLRVWF